MNTVFEKLSHILADICTLSGTCAVWKRSALCITESRAAPDFHMHNCRFCEHIKEKYDVNVCRRHDSVTVPQAVAAHHGKPFLLNCPAGAVELIVPVHNEEQTFGILFIGPFACANLRNDAELPEIDEPRALALGNLCQQLLLPLAPALVGMHPEIRPRDPRIAKVVEYIEHHYGEKITLQEMAKRFYLSPSRFSHLFIAECKQNFTDFLMNTRLMVSLDLVRFSDWSIAEIARLCGFADAGHFSTLFKQKYAMTPSAARARRQ
ncbi:MAG: helix-turn-helix domain-containing protein [Lentisphaeria bacterium]|nr:helix-turn-helix domain-containing protein [Lentisphaeria bacterium]